MDRSVVLAGEDDTIWTKADALLGVEAAERYTAATAVMALAVLRLFNMAILFSDRIQSEEESKRLIL